MIQKNDQNVYKRKKLTLFKNKMKMDSDFDPSS